MRWNDEWFRTEIAEHKHINEVLHDLCHANVSERKRKDLYRDVRRSLALHFLWEEESIHARGKEILKNESIWRIATVQHARINRMLNQMDNLDWGCDGWKRSLAQLEETVVEHIRYEEQTLLPALRTAVAKARAMAAAKMAVA